MTRMRSFCGSAVSIGLQVLATQRLPDRSEFTIQFTAIREFNMFFTSLIMGQRRNVSVETSERLRVLSTHKHEHKLEYPDTLFIYLGHEC